jgi:hypothetical protein
MSWVLCPDESVGTLPYISNSWARRLASRLSEKLHAHHNLIAPKTSVPLDHNSSRESGMLRVPQWWYASLPPSCRQNTACDHSKRRRARRKAMNMPLTTSIQGALICHRKVHKAFQLNRKLVFFFASEQCPKSVRSCRLRRARMRNCYPECA